MPHPTMPTTIRSEGAGRPALPRALAGIKVGAAMAAAVVAINWRRLTLELVEEAFISNGQDANGQTAQPAENSVRATLQYGVDFFRVIASIKQPHNDCLL